MCTGKTAVHIQQSAGAAEFRWGRSLEDRPRSGQPVEATFEENVSAVEHIIKEDQQVTSYYA